MCVHEKGFLRQKITLLGQCSKRVCYTLHTSLKLYALSVETRANGTTVSPGFPSRRQQGQE